MRLVDADVLLTAFPKGENEIFRTSAVRGTIDACPTVDAIPVVHGTWKRNKNGTYSCSECHSWIPNEQRYYANFCLYCGARMDGGENEAD